MLKVKSRRIIQLENEISLLKNPNGETAASCSNLLRLTYKWLDMMG